MNSESKMIKYNTILKILNINSLEYELVCAKIPIIFGVTV